MNVHRVRNALAAIGVAVVLAGGIVHAAGDQGDGGIQPMSRHQWVTAVLRHTDGVTRAEARRIWRHPRLRRSMPIASTSRSHGQSWSNPAIADTGQTVDGCHVWTSKTEWGYGVRMMGGTPYPAREPLFRYELHRTWTFDGWRVYPGQEWDDDYIAPFADLRWNFGGAFDVESYYLPVGGSSKATHMHSRQGQFHSIVQLGGAETDVKRSILAKWHGGWETPEHSAHSCQDN